MDHPYADGVEPLRLDREIAATARSWVNWRRALRQGEGLDADPFESRRAVSGVTTLRAVFDLAPTDPLREPLARWVLRLTEQRVNLAARVTLESARRKTLHLVEAPERGKWSHAALLKKALGDPEQRAAWFDAFISSGGEVSAVAATLWERRAELLGRTKLDLSALEKPAEDVPARAERFLASSRDAFTSLGLGSPSRFIEASLASSATGDWPARPTPHALRELAAGLVDGVDLDPGTMPEAMGPASFMRCLARVGASWAVANTPRNQPFVIAHDAYGLERLKWGALLGSLPLSGPYATKRLHVGRSQARSFARSIAISLLIAARLAALAVLARKAALTGRCAFDDMFREGTVVHLGFELPAIATGAWLCPRSDSEQRFVALLLAAGRRESLIEAHDEDWFINPRARTELREMAQLPPQHRAEESLLDLGERALTTSLFAAIGA